MTASEIDDMCDNDERMRRFAGIVAARIAPEIHKAIAAHSLSCAEIATAKAAALAAAAPPPIPRTFPDAARMMMVKAPYAVAAIVIAVILKDGLPLLARILNMQII